MQEGLCGLGPWFCALYVNLETKAKKKTELRVHTYPILFEKLSKERWVTILIVGPFEKWNDSLGFYELWAKQTRGITRPFCVLPKKVQPKCMGNQGVERNCN